MQHLTVWRGNIKFFELRAQPFRGYPCAVYGRTGQDQDEFLAAVTAEQVMRPFAGETEGAECRQRGIAGLMSPSIVHVLEMVQVEHDERQGPVVPFEPLEFLFSAFEQKSPCRRTGQGVDRRHPVELIEETRVLHRDGNRGCQIPETGAVDFGIRVAGTALGRKYADNLAFHQHWNIETAFSDFPVSECLRNRGQILPEFPVHVIDEDVFFVSQAPGGECVVGEGNLERRHQGAVLDEEAKVEGFRFPVVQAQAEGFGFHQCTDGFVQGKHDVFELQARGDALSEIAEDRQDPGLFPPHFRFAAVLVCGILRDLAGYAFVVQPLGKFVEFGIGLKRLPVPAGFPQRIRQAVQGFRLVDYRTVFSAEVDRVLEKADGCLRVFFLKLESA